MASVPEPDGSHTAPSANAEISHPESGQAVRDEGEALSRPRDKGAETTDEGEEPADEADVDEQNVLEKGELERLKVAPLRVHDVIIKGNERTKEAVIERELESVKKAETFQELAAELFRASAALESLGIFEKCLIVCEPGPEELPGTTNVVVELKEKGPVAAQVGTYVQGRERSLEGTISLRNLFGWADSVDLNVAYGQESTNTYSLALNWPRFRNWHAAASARVFQMWRNWQRHSSHTERLRGVAFSLSSEDREHEVGYELTWRELQDESQRASKPIRRQLGHSLLSSVQYTFLRDLRDSSLRPTRGYALRSSTQVAGLGPDARLLRFVKQELEGHLSLPLGFARSAVSLGVHTGVLLPWGQNWATHPTSISDRFFVGGPSTLRGFRTKGVGPTAPRRPLKLAEGQTPPRNWPARDALGGDLFVSAVAALSFDLPSRLLQYYGLHGHVFAQAANTVLLTAGEAPKGPLDFLKSFRASVGGGLVWPTKLGRLEMNYCYVLRKQEHDRVKKGIQFGLNTTAP